MNVHRTGSTPVRVTEELALVTGNRCGSYVVELSSGDQMKELNAYSAMVTPDRERLVVGSRTSVRSYSIPSIDLIGGCDIKLSDEFWPGFGSVGPSTIPGFIWAPAPENRSAFLLREADFQLAARIPMPSARPWEIGGPVNGEIA